MTDCSSIHGSTSSSSDVMTLTTAASSWCAIPTNSRIRVLRLVRPHHTRRMLMVTGPDGNPSYGFAVRGGKEFGTGFFVSQVERNSEADLKGLRIGDQILRLNNFRVEDAVHKELIRFINSQDRITLKVRGVGMLPIKDKENERLSWNVVKMHSISNTPSESSYKTVTTEHSSSCSGVGVNDLRSKDINVVLDVAPRTKLGLGICKGPEWKPGIFVQFTKDKSVAREAGLRPGDQILSVNSIDFSDVLFSEAVAVMKSSNKLEMIVRTAAGCDLFPGESSGYNSSASSVTGDQSPCWADVKQKRLTAVSEEPMIAACWNEALYAEQRRNGHGRELRPKELNKTIIKLSENGTSINNTYVANPHISSRLQSGLKLATIGQQENVLKKTSIAPPPPLPTNGIYSNIEQPGRSKNMKIDDGARGDANNTVIVDVHRNVCSEEEKRKQAMATLQRNTSKMTAASKPIGPPKAPPPVLYGNLGNYSNNNNNNNNVANDANNSNQSTTRQHNFGDVNAAGNNSTLSSAITEELKKRKEKQRSANNADNQNFVSSNSNSGSGSASNYGNTTNISRNEQQPQQQNKMTPSAITMQRQLQHQNQLKHQRQHQQNQHYQNLSQQQQQQQQHQQQQQQYHQIQTSKITTSVTSPSSVSSSSSATTSPAKRAPSVRAVNSNVANCTDRGNTLDQHSALMDEFKAAHQRMFKNGFHERESKERQEALKRTTMMDDDTSHRTSRIFTNGKSTSNDSVDGHQQQQPNHQTHQNHQNPNQQHIPPPPPQFANSPPKNNQTNGIYNYQTIKKANGVVMSNSTSTKVSKPPSSPTPDYDNLQQSKEEKIVQINSIKSIQKQNGLKSTTNSTTALPPSPTRRTIRLGAVTIGEYEQQRKEPNKFEFIGAQHQTTNNGNFHSELQNTLSRSKLKNGNNHIEHKQDCPLRNGYALENTTRKIQGVGVNQKQLTTNGESTATVKRNVSGNVYGTGNGILKNGSNRNTTTNGSNINGHNSKLIEKTITFGN